MAEKQEKMLCSKQVEDLLNYSKRTLIRWRLEGYGPKVYRYGKKEVRYKLSEVIAFRDGIQNAAE